MTFKELYEDVQQKFRDTSSTHLTNIKNWINEAQRIVLTKAPWDFNLNYQDIQTKDGQLEYDLYEPMPIGIWYAGQWVHATTTNTDDTTDAQDIASADDFSFGTTTDDDGFTIGAQVPFDRVEIKVSTVAQGSPEYVYEYCNGATWTDFKHLMLETPNLASTGTTYLSWRKPLVWAKYSGSETGLTASRFYVRVRAVTAPTTIAGSADFMKVGNFPSMKIYSILRNNVKLAQVDQRRFDTLIADPSSRTEGNPAYYSVFGKNRFRPYPVADTDGSTGTTHPSDQILRVNYFRAVQKLINDDDISIIPEEFHDLLTLYPWMVSLSSGSDPQYSHVKTLFKERMEDLVDNYITGQTMDKIRVLKSLDEIDAMPPLVRLPDDFPSLF